MEAKKTSRSNLENKRFIFREIGLVAALAMVFFAFETKYYQEEAGEIIIPVTAETPEEILPIFVPQKAQMMPKINIKPIDYIDIVDDMPEFSEEELDLSDAPINTNGSLTGTDANPYGDYGDSEGEFENDKFIVVEDMPRFNGNLKQWLRKNLRYPTRASEMGIEGKVFVQFTVEKDGSITEVVTMGKADPELAAEAMRVVKAMPKWIPGMQRKKPVRVSFTIPVVFKLN